MEFSEVLEHSYTPHGFNEMHNTLSCHQMGGLVSVINPETVPVEMGIFQAQHLLEAGYILVYAPDIAADMLQVARGRGDI